MTMKRFFAAAMAALSVFAITGQASAQRGGANVVLIDQQKVLGESAAVKSINDQLQAVAQQVTADLEQKQATLQQEAQALQQTRESMSREDFQKRASAFASKELDLLADQEIANREIAVARNNALAQLDEPFRAAVEAIAKKRKGAIVLEKSLVIYAGNAPEVTDDVVKELDRKISTVQVVKPTTSAEERAAIRQQLERQLAMQQVEAVGRRQMMALGQQSLQAAQQ